VREVQLLRGIGDGGWDNSPCSAMSQEFSIIPGYICDDDGFVTERGSPVARMHACYFAPQKRLWSHPSI
jgi:hypothetical protein